MPLYKTKLKKTEDAYILGLRDVLPGIIQLLPRIPKIAFNLKKTLSIKPENLISLGKIIEQNALLHKDKAALMYEEQHYSHHEFNEIVNQYANYFLKIGVSKNDTVVVFIENRPEILFLIGALAKIGAIASLINPNQRGSVLKHSVQLDTSTYFIIGEELIQEFEEIRSELNLNKNAQLYWIEDTGKQTCPTNYLNLKEELLQISKENPSTTNSITAGQRYANIFTSGTTGLPKASIQTHKKWIQMYYWFGKINLNFNDNDVVYVPIPFYHTNALIVAWPSAMANGSAIVIRRKFSVTHFWEDVKKYNVSSFIYIGEICRYLLNAAPSGLEKTHRITKIFGNGLRPDIWKPFQKRFTIKKVFEFYGAADGNVGFTNTLSISSSVGWGPTKYAIVKYDVENDEPFRGSNGFFSKVSKGNTGLLLGEINHKVAFDGYVNKKHNEEKIFRNVFTQGDVWFNSGDLMRDIGFRHAQFVDRTGDTFRWKGENVSTGEIEAFVNELNEVSNCAVYGVQIPNCDGRAGMIALITEQDATIDLEFLATHLINKLPRYAVPLFIRLCNELETTHTHKIKKTTFKKEGINTSDKIFVMLPKTNNYIPMSMELKEKINNGDLIF
jgi:citronellyl-CoA synthetase